MNQFDAAKGGDLKRVQELVTGANDAHAVLHFACYGGHHHIVEWLLRIGANVNARNDIGETPLHYAAANSHPHCVRLLLEAGADAGISHISGRIPLHYACCSSSECAALLIAAHAIGVQAVDNNGTTPLHQAARYGTVDVVRLLLASGSVVDALDNDGRTPLHFALREGKREVAEMLLVRGAHTNRVKWDKKMGPIKEWAISIMPRRKACELSCWALLELARRRSQVIGGNNRDVMRIVARIVWDSRRDACWERENQEKRSERCIVY